MLQGKAPPHLSDPASACPQIAAQMWGRDGLRSNLGDRHPAKRQQAGK
jgi:hypothetical protein